MLLAATLNFGFFIGDIANPELHNVYELFAAVVVNLIATVLKFGDRTQIGAVHLATSLVADLQLIAAGVVWVVADQCRRRAAAARRWPAWSRCPAGALLANIVSVVLLVVETLVLPQVARHGQPAADVLAHVRRAAPDRRASRPGFGPPGILGPHRRRRRGRSSWCCAGCGSR